MKYKVELKIFQDDDLGYYGIAHKNAINKGFNAFWNGIGIFHDVFEHYFEDKHKYFKNDYSFNVAGEIASMGHLSYYYFNYYYLQNRKTNEYSMNSFEEAIIRTTSDMMIEAIQDGYINFGSILLCKIPKQKFYDNNLEDIIQTHWNKVKNVNVKKHKTDTKQVIKEKINYKKSIKLSKLRNLYTWGFKQAEKIAPWSNENYNTLNDFIKYWNKFCKDHKAEDLLYNFKEIHFNIIGGKQLKWECIFISNNNEEIKLEDIENYILEYEYT